MQTQYKGQELIESKFGTPDKLFEAYTELEKQNKSLKLRERRFALMPLLKRRHDLASYPPAFLSALVLGLQVPFLLLFISH